MSPTLLSIEQDTKNCCHYLLFLKELNFILLHVTEKMSFSMLNYNSVDGASHFHLIGNGYIDVIVIIFRILPSFPMLAELYSLNMEFVQHSSFMM